MPDTYIIDNKEWDFPDPEGNDFVDSKLIDKEFTENGTYNTEDEPGDINGYKEVTVNVEGGKSVTLITKNITENGEYLASSDNADGYSRVDVSVPVTPAPTLISKSITQNGTYDPSDDQADGYSSVVVNVPINSNFGKVAINTGDFIDVSIDVKGVET